MTVALGEAIKQHKDIVITGWSPHWMFNKYDLKYLADPKEQWELQKILIPLFVKV